MWIGAGRVDDIAARGFLRRDVANASVLLVRDGDAVRAFHNVCRHRGTRLCDAETGALSGSIQCPYHGWTYGLDGRLIGAPQMDDVAGFAKDDYPLRRVCRARCGTATFSSTSTIDPPPLETQLGELPDAFRPWRMSELRRVHRLDYTVQANWKLIVQNYNECLHCPIIHPLLNRMHHYLGASNVPSTGTYCGGAMGFKDGVETLSVDGRRRRARAPGSRRGRAAAGQLLRDLSEPAADPASGLHAHDHHLARDAGSHASGERPGTFIPTRSRGPASCGRTRSSSGTSPTARTGRSPSDRIAASRHAATRRARTRTARPSCGSSIASSCPASGE